MEHRVILYANGPRDWRWKRRAANGEVVANGTEGYAEQDSAVKALKSVNAPPYILIVRGLHGEITRTPVGVMEKDDIIDTPAPPAAYANTRPGRIASAIKDFLNQPENVNGYYYGTMAEHIERKLVEWESE